MYMVLSPVSLKELVWCFVVGEACLCGYLFVASLLRCICSLIPEYCSPVWGSAAECHLQLLERQVYSVARLCPNQTIDVMLLHCVCCTKLIRTQIIVH